MTDRRLGIRNTITYHYYDKHSCLCLYHFLHLSRYVPVVSLMSYAHILSMWTFKRRPQRFALSSFAQITMLIERILSPMCSLHGAGRIGAPLGIPEKNPF